MPRLSFTIMTLAFVLTFGTYAPAMQNTSPQSHAEVDYGNFTGVEQVCAPDADARLYESQFVLNHQEMEKVRIELLESGFNPGFPPYDSPDSQLIEALMKFQSEYQLPVTGLIDATTLDALRIPIMKSSGSVQPELTRRAKPSQ